MSDAATTAAPEYTAHPFDARGIARRFRHSAIFGALGALQPGEAMRFVNDHDPLPLLAQIQDRFGDRIGIAYRQREPGAIVIDFIVRASTSSQGYATSA
ncbi:hypothetical protein GCM10007164_19640 [Luteimonas padinae]|uniref:DUF2249 domain-containing protein n=1 Tax=Luteimonas padinae TaxID=1714359 RepID=A0ABV6SWI5_9GAMM|nr:DUF2249 domain-containing protein [Luteimonas padinae]GHD72208.1 hypothetical protein GCM10007164_19640 [Luteimonas padinae]